MKCWLSGKASPLYGSRATSDQWVIRLQKYHKEPRKFLLEEVASLDGRLDRRYQVPNQPASRGMKQLSHNSQVEWLT